MDSAQHHRKHYVLEGIVLIILGILAIFLPAFTTLSLTLLIGWILLIGGIIQLYRTFKGVKASSFWISLINCLLAIIIGILLLLYPLHGMMFLTLLLGIFFLFQGITQIAMGIQIKPISNNWGFLVVSGIVSIILSILIWIKWPSISSWFIGLLVGINLLLFGISLLFFSKKVQQP
ncbi:HdeD family acid-resistance protein [Candidiatus Paracoxiella cheracis]|uniref:HdeD family acid-resistance protein n=1 Tax=Candidiatus Paracoxiella cheracis TaxID=3405120 RepID=UPI003BF4BBA3